MTAHLQTVLPGASFSEGHGRFARFMLNNVTSTLGLGSTFKILHSLLERNVETDGWQIENYSVSQCSLEQVFLKLAQDDMAAPATEPEALEAEDV